MEKTEELRFLSMEDLRASKQRSGDLIGRSAAVTGGQGCFFSNCICFPVSQQSQHGPGWRMSVSGAVCTHSKPACGVTGSREPREPAVGAGGAPSWAAAPTMSRTGFHLKVHSNSSSLWFPGPGGQVCCKDVFQSWQDLFTLGEMEGEFLRPFSRSLATPCFHRIIESQTILS